jgi:hypothetical protein
VHSYYAGTKLPGDPITGMRMIYECIKSLHLQNGNLTKNLKEAKGQVADTRDELDKWRRARASVIQQAPAFHDSTHLFSSANVIFCSFFFRGTRMIAKFWSYEE